MKRSVQQSDEVEAELVHLSTETATRLPVYEHISSIRTLLSENDVAIIIGPTG